MNTELLVNSETRQVTEYRKYYIQVLDMQKIGYFDIQLICPYIISLGDLTLRLKHELLKLDGIQRGFVLRQAVGRLFEDVNSKLYHTSISQVLKVRLVR